MQRDPPANQARSFNRSRDARTQSIRIPVLSGSGPDTASIRAVEHGVDPGGVATRGGPPPHQHNRCEDISGSPSTAIYAAL